MPYTSYTPYSYSNYGTSRPYSGNKNYSSYDTSTSSYPRKNPYELKSSATNSTTNYDIGERKKQIPTFLSGNTASLRKAFGAVGSSDGDNDSVSSSTYAYGLKRDTYTKSPERTYGLRSSGLYGKNEASAFTPVSGRSNYLARKGIHDPPRPKEIDSTQINLCTKPPYIGQLANNNKHETNSGDWREITRARQPVRFTITRNSDEDKKEPYEVKKNSIKTVAQKLLDKYTITDLKKSSAEPLSYGPRDRFFFSNSRLPSSSNRYDDEKDAISTILDKRTKNFFESRPISVSTKTKEDTISKSNTAIENISNNRLENFVSISDIVNGDKKRRLSKPGAELEDGCIVFCRATENAVNKKDIESAEEVKDIIVAASLHPDIDIESDEEIKQLIEADNIGGPNSLPPTSSILSNFETNLHKKSSPRRVNRIESFNKNKSRKCSLSGSTDAVESPVQNGTIIVDKLKRFVKKQVSIKRSSFKKEIEAKNLNCTASNNKEADGNHLNECDNSNSVKSNLLAPSEEHCEKERYFKKSPTPHVALKEGMEKIKISIALCEDIFNKKEDEEIKQDYRKNHDVLAVTNDNKYELSSSASSTCLHDAPWRKNRQQRKINKSKTSANLMSGFSNDDELDFWNVLNTPLAKSPSAYNLDKYKGNVDNSSESRSDTLIQNYKTPQKNIDPNTIENRNKNNTLLITKPINKFSFLENSYKEVENIMPNKNNKNDTSTRLSYDEQKRQGEKEVEGRKLYRKQKLLAKSNSPDSSACSQDKKAIPPLASFDNCSGLVSDAHNKKMDCSTGLKYDSQSQDMPNKRETDSKEMNSRLAINDDAKTQSSEKKERHYNILCTYNVKEILANSQNAETKKGKSVSSTRNENISLDKNTVDTDQLLEIHGSGNINEVENKAAPIKPNKIVNEDKVKDITLNSIGNFPKLNDATVTNKPAKIGLEGNKRGVCNKLLEKRKSEKTYAYVVKENNEGDEEILNVRNILKKPTLEKEGKGLTKSDLSSETKLPESYSKKPTARKKIDPSNESPALKCSTGVKGLH